MPYNETPMKGSTMSEQSLMNPDYLKTEIHDLYELIAKDDNTVKELQEKYDRIIDMLRDSHNEGESTTLTFEQTRELIETLGYFNHNIFVFSSLRKFYLRVYKVLLSDRRYYIATKYLKFIQK